MNFTSNIYWAGAIGVFISKCLGYTNISWFWATFMIMLPIYTPATILSIILGIILIALIFCIPFIIIGWFINKK